MTKEDVTKEIVKCIGMSAPGPHAVVFVTGIVRFTVEEQETVGHFTTFVGQGQKRHMIVLYIVFLYITNLVCYTYFHWFFSPECLHIFGKQTGYIFQSLNTIKKWTTKH
jgi:hypothetical protein